MVWVSFSEDEVKKEFDDEKLPKKEKERKGETKAPKVTLYGKVKNNPVREVSKLIVLTENAMQNRQAVWDRYRRKYRRGLYYLTSLSSGAPLYFTNYIFSTIETVKANITRNLPAVTASPRGQRDDLAADLISRVLNDSFERGGLKQATREVVHNGLIATLGHFKVYFDEAHDGLVVHAISPDDLLIDPKATSIDDMRWAIHKRRNVAVDEIYATYGSIPKLDANADSKRTTSDVMAGRDGLYVTDGELRPAIDVAPTYDVYEAWVRCWDEDRENDWYVVVIAGDTVLDEFFSPYNHNKTPFVTWIAVEDYSGDNIYHKGVGYVEQIEPLQDRVDALDLKLYKNTSLLANRQKYVASNSGLNINTMDNTAGRTYKVNGDPARAVFYDSPPQLSQSIYEYRDRTEMLIQVVSGVFDVTMGRRPTGITAGRAIESLKDSAETRIASVADTLAESLRDVASLGLQIILQFYDGERIIKATDGDEDMEFVVVADYPPELQPQPEMEIDSFGFPLIDPETEEPILVNPDMEPEVTPELEQMRAQWKEEAGIALVLADVTYEWDIRVDTDSALPSARAERGQVAADLFRLGAIDREALLESMDFPSRHKILQRLAAEATGKNAGDPMVDETEGQGQVEQMLMLLQQMGLPPEMLEELMAQMQGGQPQQQQQGGNFPPQMTI